MTPRENSVYVIYDCFDFPFQTSLPSFFRPWVVIEKQVGLKNIKASIGTLFPKSEVSLYTFFFPPLFQ